MNPTSHRRRYASLIVVPPGSNEPLNFNLPSWAYYLLIGGIPALVVLVVGGIVLTSWMGAQLRGMRELEELNFALESEAAKARHLELRIDELEGFRLKVLDMVGADVRDEMEARAEARAEESASDTGLSTASIALGSGEPMVSSVPDAPSRYGTMPSLWPVEGVISRDYSVDEGSTIHHGIDIAAPHRAPVRASGAGTVAFAGRDSVFGEFVVLDHGKNVRSLYGHNSSLAVGPGVRVKRGEVIAYVGSTGESSAPHLHFEVRRGGNVINPRTYLVE